MADSSPAAQSVPVSGATRATVARTATNHFAVSGALTFATARSVLASGIEAFTSSSAGPLDVDFSGVNASDSAGLAVLIEWLAWARRNGRELNYSAVPEAICAIARISEVDALLLRR